LEILAGLIPKVLANETKSERTTFILCGSRTILKAHH